MLRLFPAFDLLSHVHYIYLKSFVEKRRKTGKEISVIFAMPMAVSSSIVP